VQQGRNYKSMTITLKKGKSIRNSSSIQTLTVGPGITPDRSARGGFADFHRRSGIAPCPEEHLLLYLAEYFSARRQK